MAKFYWAYGSNLNIQQMKRRCPRAVPLAPLNIKDGELVFRGVADVQLRKGGIIPGGLWRITPDCERALDQYEGVAAKMYAKRYLSIRVKNEVGDCLFYQMRSKGIMPPSEFYLDTIIQGYKDFNLDLLELEAAVARSWEDKDKTPDMKERYLRKGRQPMARFPAA